MKTVTLFGIDIKYKIEDTGKPKVLFIHGYESSSIFVNSLLELERNYDIVALDLPGNGKTEFIGDLSIEFFAEVVKEFIFELNLKDIKIVGHSMGGAIAMFISDLPEVKKIILVNALNPYSYSEAKKIVNPVHVIKNVINRGKDKNAKEKASRFFEFALDYKNKNRFLVKKQLLNEEWQANDLYKKYILGASKSTIIYSENDQIIMPSSNIKTANSFKIPKTTIKSLDHSPISKNPKKFNAILKKLI